MRQKKTGERYSVFVFCIDQGWCLSSEHHHMIFSETFARRDAIYGIFPTTSKALQYPSQQVKQVKGVRVIVYDFRNVLDFLRVLNTAFKQRGARVIACFESVDVKIASYFGIWNNENQATVTKAFFESGVNVNFKQINQAQVRIGVNSYPISEVEVRTYTEKFYNRLKAIKLSHFSHLLRNANSGDEVGTTLEIAH